MSLSQEIETLDQLRQRGALTDDEFTRAKARLLDAAAPEAGSPAIAAMNRLRRSRADSWLGGVCGGLAELTGMASWLWRLSFALLALCGGVGVMLYVLLWIFVPPAGHTPGPVGTQAA